MRATVLTPLLLLSWSLQALGQSPASSPGEKPALEAQSPGVADNELKLVVALFRHGVRAPLKPVDDPTKKPHAGSSWPTLTEWGAAKWGYLTPHGHDLAKALGNYYAEWYRNNGWPGGFKVYLWADTDQQTLDTADALFQGFEQGRIPKENVTVRCKMAQLSTKNDPSPKNADPLFHPFEAGCGTPNRNILEETVTKINTSRQEAAQELESRFAELYRVLNCGAALSCLPLKTVVYSVERCTADKDSPGKCESPIIWSETISGKPGPFPYASTASEAFVLEYANNMPLNLVGWGKVDAAKMLSMMQIHEKYFDLTERYDYLAQIQGSNLIREILDQLKRKADEPTVGNCPHANQDSDFVGLIGHDTNLASVNTLLKLGWTFDDKGLPPDTFGLPANDALPAGALVFELRQRTDGYWVRVEYVTQSLEQMRNGPTVKAFRLAVHGGPCRGKQPCEISLTNFEQLVKAQMGPEFLSGCTNRVPKEQSCSGPTGAP
jgi:4-phytase/acid phosphatase